VAWSLLAGCGTPAPTATAPFVAAAAPVPAVAIPTVAWSEQLGLALQCPAPSRLPDGSCPADPTGWAEPYDGFFAQPEARAAAAPIADCEGELRRLLALRLVFEEWLELSDWGPDFAPQTLGRQAWRAAHMEFLLDDLPARRIEAVVVQEGAHNKTREQRVVVRDRFAGEVPMRVFLPPGPGPHPAVIVLPGHAEDGAFHFRQRYGQRLVDAGFAVVLVDFRAYRQDSPGGRHPETDAARRFFCQGQNLGVMRAYEGLLALWASAAHPAIDGARLGVLGHSGGSSTAHLLVWLREAPARAWVVDGAPSHVDIDKRPDGYDLDCGVHPGLHGVSGMLSDVCQLPPEWGRAIQRVPYGYNPGLQPQAGECRIWPFEGSSGEPDPRDPAPAQWFVPFFGAQLGAGSDAR
jgi:hypothetical protein